MPRFSEVQLSLGGRLKLFGHKLNKLPSQQRKVLDGRADRIQR